MRAFFYFYEVNLYGNSLLLLTTDFKANGLAARVSPDLVYQQIITDLKDAQGLLNTNFVGSDGITTSTERSRPTSWAATALLARVYLYRKDYANAAIQASALISNSPQFSLTDLNSAFLKNSTEAIWQLQPVTLDTIRPTQLFSCCLPRLHTRIRLR